jgi:precorrin-6Y C5,15-methyltransferase (decarboxylating)
MKFYVIGIDDSQIQHFPDEVSEVIASHAVFSGGSRHHEIVSIMLPDNYQWIDITVPLDKVFEQYIQHTEIVVFASGDPLFFGFANTIQRKMPEAEIVLYPYFNSLQLLAHRLLMPYQDMHIVSLTGRPWHKFDEALITGYTKIGILTDSKEHTPANIARRMFDYGYDNYTMSVGELLGNKEKERVTTLDLKDVIGKEFAFPNNLILQKTDTRPRPFGIPEGNFNLLDGREKMITKMPIRLLSLNMLDLRARSVFWDIGFCTGSVSIEVKMQFPDLQIIAFEKREESRELIESNARKFGTPGIRSVIGDFVETDITGFPQPDAVFIGGHGGKMNEIIEKVSGVLQPGGVVVFNSVSAESRKLFEEAVKPCNLKLERNISITIDDFNRIDVMKAIKQI